MNPFLKRAEPYTNDIVYDKFYVSEVMHTVYKQVGDTDKYLPEIVVEVQKEDIDKLINSQANDVGIEAYLRPYAVAGTEPPGVEVSEDIQDFTDFPDNMAEAAALGQSMQEIFAGLDPELTQGKTIDQFLASLNENTLKDYIDRKFPKQEIKSEKKENKESEENK